MSFTEKSLKTLELPTILELLACQATSTGAKEECRNLRMSTDADEVRRRLNETDAARKLIAVRGTPSFSGIKDIRGSVERADLGGTLNTRELLDLASLLRCARLVKAYFSADDRFEKTSIDYLFSALRANKFLEEKISAAILAEDEIADGASPELSDIRRKIRVSSAKARDALQKIISSPSYGKALQESIITMRSGRYVVPVKAEYKNAVPGLVHDVSATGATLFIEPMAAVKANNELRELFISEKAEIERILAELSADCAEHRDDIESDYQLLVKLDFIFAKGGLSYELDCCAPETSESGLILRQARHPLLGKDVAVPINLEIGDSYDTLIITGPNTGGKTVALKTIGLLSAMNQCGLHIPVADGSCLPVFSHILADIGDEQSIEQSLSTFSAHMRNIVSIIEEADERSLVLFDELGAGTDPTEGAALAISIIENVRSRKAIVAATTHYTELKVYATNEDGVVNASCEFDVDTLRPTYHLLIGIPGKSNAFAISRRLGLPESIIEEARNRVSAGNSSFESTIEKLEETRLQLEKSRDEVETKLRNISEEEKKAKMLRAELEVRLEKANVKARREAEQMMAEAREAVEAAFREIDEMKSRLNDAENVDAINQARNELRKKLNETEQSFAPHKEEDKRESSRPVVVGDLVEIKNVGMEAEVIEISPDRILTLKAGIMRVTAKEDEVYLLTEKKKPQKTAPKSAGIQLHAKAVSSEIDLRGMDSIEAVGCAELFLDNAVLGNLHQVSLIHGKGTGVLRKAIHDMLRKNKCVKSFRLGNFGEGESGVTIVELK